MKNEKQNKQSILLVTAHADDNIAAAGTIFKLQSQGFDVYEIILTASNEGRDFRKRTKAYNVAKLRSREFSKASKFLGTKAIFQLNQDDLELTYSKQLMLKVVKIIRQVKPTVGIIMNEFDWHPDHVVAAKIGSTAFKIAATGIQPKLGEAFRAPIVLAVEGMLPIKPSILVDITNFYTQKEALFKIYESQASSKALGFQEGLAKIRGYHLRRVGSLLAEAFTTDETSPMILFDNLKGGLLQ